jgi:hypothetical protein
MMIKIIDENEKELYVEEILGNTIIQAHDFAVAHAPDEYSLKNVVVIHNNGSDTARDIFKDPKYGYGGNMVIIEVEKIKNEE